MDSIEHLLAAVFVFTFLFHLFLADSWTEGWLAGLCHATLASTIVATASIFIII